MVMAISEKSGSSCCNEQLHALNSPSPLCCHSRHRSSPPSRTETLTVEVHWLHFCQPSHSQALAVTSVEIWACFFNSVSEEFECSIWIFQLSFSTNGKQVLCYTPTWNWMLSFTMVMKEVLSENVNKKSSDFKLVAESPKWNRLYSCLLGSHQREIQLGLCGRPQGSRAKICSKRQSAIPV